MVDQIRQNTYFDKDTVAVIRAEQERRFPGRGLTFSMTINAIIREWAYFAEQRRQAERDDWSKDYPSGPAALFAGHARE